MSHLCFLAWSLTSVTAGERDSSTGAHNIEIEATAAGRHGPWTSTYKLHTHGP